MAKVEFKNIKKSFGDVTEVVKEFDFTVEATVVSSWFSLAHLAVNRQRYACLPV